MLAPGGGPGGPPQSSGPVRDSILPSGPYWPGKKVTKKS